MRRLQLTGSHADTVGLLKAHVAMSSGAAVLHRLHCVVLVAAGLSCARVAAAFGDDPRSVQRWVRRFEEAGVEGLQDTPMSGRPASLGDADLHALRLALQADPRLSGHASGTWNVQALRQEIDRRFGVAYSLRHCARLLTTLRGVPESAATASREDTVRTTEDAAEVLSETPVSSASRDVPVAAKRRL